MERGFIFLASKDVKERKKKKVPIHRNARKVFEHLLHDADCEFVFAENKKVMSPKMFRQELKEACAAVGITYGMKVEGGFRFHDTRRTVKSYMVAAGLNKVVIDLMLGHSLRGMDAFYINLDDAVYHAEMEKYTVWLDDMVSSVNKVDQSVDQIGKRGQTTMHPTPCNYLVPEVGIEPTRPQGTGDFESPASTSFTTPACGFRL